MKRIVFVRKFEQIWELANLLKRSDRLKLILLGFSQLTLAILDLLGLLSIGAVSTLSLSLISGSSPSPSLQRLLRFRIFENQSFEKIIIILAMASAVLLITKTITSAILSRKIVGFLALREAQFSSRYIDALLKTSPQTILSKTPQYLYGVASAGANSAFTVSLSQFVNLAVEVFSILILFTGLSFVDLTITIPTLFFFGLSGVLTSKILSKTFRKTGMDNYLLGVSANEFIVNASSTIRDIHVANQESRISDLFTNIRLANYSAAKSRAFASLLPKYVAEVTLVVGSMFIAGTQILIKDMRSAIAGLVVFLAMGSRIAPAILRIQNAIMEIQAAEFPSRNFLEEYQHAIMGAEKLQQIDSQSHEKIFTPSISLQNVSASYLDSDSAILANVDLQINPGDFVAIVGPSGAGKTTLVDLILGILPAIGGSIQIGGLSPNDAIHSFPNQIRYVPQDIYLLSATIAENLAWPSSFDISNETRMLQVLDLVNLRDWFDAQSNGLETMLDNSGVSLSGGQRQRLGIARALYSNPTLLFLDEATSSLDVETESIITNRILIEMKNITRVVIAHRLSTVRNANRIINVVDGRVREITDLSELGARSSEYEID